MSHRIERINALIRRETSELLRRVVKDPRLGGFIAITDVVTSPDLKTARIFISFLGSSIDKKEAMAALTAATGFFRKELAKILRLRHMPELSFHWDDSIERGAHIEELLDQVVPEKDIERDTESK